VSGPVRLSAAELEAFRRQAEAEYPAECCGVVLARGEAEREVLACRNAQDALHARDPERYPRTSRHAYYIAPGDLLEIGRRQTGGWDVAVIYHSHVDAGAYFSETDRRNALVAGEPAYPGVAYVVLAVRGGRVDEVRAHRWDAGAREFVEAPLSVA
jgi:proteasome lid subunit RPN8/RPN11